MLSLTISTRPHTTKIFETRIYFVVVLQLCIMLSLTISTRAKQKYLKLGYFFSFFCFCFFAFCSLYLLKLLFFRCTLFCLNPVCWCFDFFFNRNVINWFMIYRAIYLLTFIPSVLSFFLFFLATVIHYNIRVLNFTFLTK